MGKLKKQKVSIMEKCLQCKYSNVGKTDLNCNCKSSGIGYFVGRMINNDLYIQTPSKPSGTIRKSLPTWCAYK